MEQNLSVNTRQPGKSSDARRLRRQGLIPGVLYGKREEAFVTVSELEFMRLIGHSIGSGMIGLVLDGKKKPENAIVKDVQWDALTGRPVHIDFLRVAMDDIVTVPIPVHLLNSPVGVSVSGGVLDHHMHEVLVRVRASEIPSEIVLDVSELDIGDSLHVSDLDFPEGVESESNLEAVVVSVLAPTILKLEEEEVEEEGEELEEGAVEGEEEGEAAPQPEEDAGDSTGSDDSRSSD
jgi:large subunit ribosomal protein L25